MAAELTTTTILLLLLLLFFILFFTNFELMLYNYAHTYIQVFKENIPIKRIEVSLIIAKLMHTPIDIDK